MFNFEGHNLVEVGDAPEVIGSRSIGDPFPQYWHKLNPLGSTGGLLLVLGAVDFMDCPIRFNVNNGACDPVIFIGDSTAATPHTVVDFGTMGTLKDIGSKVMQLATDSTNLSVQAGAEVFLVGTTSAHVLAALGNVNITASANIVNTATAGSFAATAGTTAAITGATGLTATATTGNATLLAIANDVNVTATAGNVFLNANAGNVDITSPLRINVSNADVSPTVFIGDSIAATPHTVIDFGTMGTLKNLGSNIMQLATDSTNLSVQAGAEVFLVGVTSAHVLAALGNVNITASANVDITATAGQVNILNILHVAANAIVDTGLVINEDSASGTSLRMESNGDINWVTALAGTERFGIGAGASPSSALHVKTTGQGALYVDSTASDGITFRSSAGATFFDINTTGPWGTNPILWDWASNPPAFGPSQKLTMNNSSIAANATWATFTGPHLLDLTRTITGFSVNSGSLSIVQTESGVGGFAGGSLPIKATLNSSISNTSLTVADFQGTWSANTSQKQAVFAKTTDSNASTAGEIYAVNSESIVSAASAATPIGYRGFGLSGVAGGHAIGVKGFSQVFAGTGLSRALVGLTNAGNPNQNYGLDITKHSWFNLGVQYHFASTTIALAPTTDHINPAADTGSVYIEKKLEVDDGIWADGGGVHHGAAVADFIKTSWGIADDCTVYWDSSDMIIDCDALGSATSGLLRFINPNNWTANGTNAATLTSLAPAGVTTSTVAKWFTVKDDTGGTFFIPAWT